MGKPSLIVNITLSNTITTEKFLLKREWSELDDSGLATLGKYMLVFWAALNFQRLSSYLKQTACIASQGAAVLMVSSFYLNSCLMLGIVYFITLLLTWCV
jgi:hypothetical protein